MSPDLLAGTKPSIKEAYKQFLNTEEGVQAYQYFKQILYAADDSLVQTLNNTILQNLSVISTDVLNVCDIGGGDGRRITKILEFLHDKFALRFNLDFVEQSSALMRAFNTGEGAAFTDIRKFETLFENADLRGGYDLVFLIHSIFAFQNGSAVDKVLSLPNSRGIIVAVSNAKDSFLAGLKRLLDVDYDGSQFEITDLVKILEKRALRFQQIPFETKWAVRQEALSRGTEAILNWLSLGRYKDLTDSRKREIWRYIRENSSDLGQRVLFSEREVVVLVHPPGQPDESSAYSYFGRIPELGREGT